MSYCPDCKQELRIGGPPHMCPDRFMREANERLALTTGSQSVIGYRLQDGTDKMECFFLPGRPQQKTLDMVAEHLKAGWILTDVIRPANDEAEARRQNLSNNE